MSGAAHKLQQARDCLRQGDVTLAEVLCLDVLRHAPGHGDATGLLGMVHARAGRFDQAAELLTQASRSEPGVASHPFNLGMVLQQQNRHVQALAAFDVALRIHPEAAQAHHLRGIALKNLDRLDEALQAYDQAIARQPAFVAALNNKATVLRRMERYEEAVDCYRQALAHSPSHPEIWSNLGLALSGAHRQGEALQAFERARALGDTSPMTQMNIGVMLNELHRPGEALPFLEEVVRAMPNDASARLNLGNALAGLDRADEALAQFHQVLEHHGQNDADAALNIANTLRDTERCEEAVDWYKRALDNGAPGDLVRWNRSLCLLSMGNYKEGWRDYEARRQLSALGNGPRNFGKPQWLGEPVAGKTVLLHAEQGFGDTIQFCRYARLVSALGAHVVLEVQPPLLALLAHLEGVDELVARGQALPAFDLHCPLMSLPLALGTTLETIPGATPYLHADPALVAQWRSTLHQPGRLQIGVAWAGNPDNWNDRRRSLPFEQFRAALPDCADFWSLQKSTPQAQAGGVPVRTFERTEFAHTAAQIMALDLVVTVDTSLAHLAGALGRPVLILLPRPADMRWLLDCNRSPWYPSAQLFRQHRLGQWDGVLNEVAEEIAQRSRALRGHAGG
mgnify:CR=1 FL=1